MRASAAQSLVQVTGSNLNITYAVLGVALVALAIAVALRAQVLSASEGTEKMREIAGAVLGGAVDARGVLRVEAEHRREHERGIFRGVRHQAGGVDVVINLAGILGASFAPYIATWLATNYGLQFVGYYLSAMAMVSLIALLMVRSLPTMHARED